LGKASGGWIQQLAFVAAGTKDVLSVAPFFGVVVGVVVAAWVWAIGRLNTSYQTLLKSQETKSE
jgi:ATP/ADP translocase